MISRVDELWQTVSMPEPLSWAETAPLLFFLMIVSVLSLPLEVLPEYRRVAFHLVQRVTAIVAASIAFAMLMCCPVLEHISLWLQRLPVLDSLAPFVRAVSEAARASGIGLMLPGLSPSMLIFVGLLAWLFTRDFTSTARPQIRARKAKILPRQAPGREA